MKTTLWSREEAERARALLDGFESDVRDVLDELDQAVTRVAYHEVEFDRAKPKHAAPHWIALVQAQDVLDAALDGLERVVQEAGTLNGAIDYERGGRLNLAGQAEDGSLVYWVRADGGLEARPVHQLGAARASTAA